MCYTQNTFVFTKYLVEEIKFQREESENLPWGWNGMGRIPSVPLSSFNRQFNGLIINSRLHDKILYLMM